MNYGVHSQDLTDTYGARYSAPYWAYIVGIRKPADTYSKTLDFGDWPLSALNDIYPIVNGDVLEVFLLNKRVLFSGVTVWITSAAVGVVLQPCTRSGVVFDTIDCSAESTHALAPFGGTLEAVEELQDHSFVVEEPDYLGFRVVSGAAGLLDLRLYVFIDVHDEFSLTARTNSTKGQ